MKCNNIQIYKKGMSHSMNWQKLKCQKKFKFKGIWYVTKYEMSQNIGIANYEDGLEMDFRWTPRDEETRSIMV